MHTDPERILAVELGSRKRTFNFADNLQLQEDVDNLQPMMLQLSSKY